MKIKIYTKIDPNFIREWQSFWDKSPFANYSNSTQWFLSVIESFNYKNYAIIAIYKKEQLIAVAAFIKKRKYGIDVYTTPPEDFACGLPFLADINDELLMNMLINQILELGTLCISNIPEKLSQVIKNTTKKSTIFKGTLNFFMPLEKDASGQMVIKNKSKIMQKAQDIENDISLTTYDCGSSIDALNIAFMIDNISTKRSKGYNAFADKEICTFFKFLAKNYKEKLLINVLYDREKPIGYEIGFAINNTFYGNQIATVSGYEKYSLGRIFIIKLIESLGKRGINKIDFGSGEDHIKKSFTKNYQALYTIVISKYRHIHMYLNTMFRFSYLVYKFFHRYPKVYYLYRRLR
jgi:hypothetical protein